MTVEHTARARSIMGDDCRSSRPRSQSSSEIRSGRGTAARGYASGSLQLPNYASNLRTLGYGDADFEGDASDRLIDAIVPWGDVETVAARGREHHEAGAEPRLRPGRGPVRRFPLAGYRELAAALL